MPVAASYDPAELQAAKHAVEVEQAKLHAELSMFRQNRAEFVKQREEVMSAPITDDEMADLLCDLVDRQAEDYLKDFSSTFGRLRVSASILTNPQNSASLDPSRAMSRIPRKHRDDLLPLLHAMALSAKQAGLTFSKDIRESALFYLLRDPIKDGIRRAVAETTISGSITMAERAKKLAKLDKQIEAVDASIKKAVG